MGSVSLKEIFLFTKCTSCKKHKIPLSVVDHTSFSPPFPLFHHLSRITANKESLINKQTTIFNDRNFENLFGVLRYLGDLCINSCKES